MIEQVDSLDQIIEPYAGQVVYCIEDGKVYRFDATEAWQEVKSENTVLSMNAYDMNKQIIGQLQILDKEVLAEKKQMIYSFCEDTHNTYYMLLCRELNYYTVFCRQPKANEYIADVLLECIDTLGDVKAIDSTEDGAAIEIWIDNPCFEDSVHVLYFFPYDGGVEVCQ